MIKCVLRTHTYIHTYVPMISIREMERVYWRWKWINCRYVVRLCWLVRNYCRLVRAYFKNLASCVRYAAHSLTTRRADTRARLCGRFRQGHGTRRNCIWLSLVKKRNASTVPAIEKGTTRSRRSYTGWFKLENNVRGKR